jgi:hypothetical protein
MVSPSENARYTERATRAIERHSRDNGKADIVVKKERPDKVGRVVEVYENGYGKCVNADRAFKVVDHLCLDQRLAVIVTAYYRRGVTNMISTLSQVIHGDIVALENQTEKIHIVVAQLQTHADRELRNGPVSCGDKYAWKPNLIVEKLPGRLSKWLGLPDPSTNFNTALEKHHVETGLWLLSSQHFEEWKTSTPSLMWLHGNGML